MDMLRRLTRRASAEREAAALKAATSWALVAYDQAVKARRFANQAVDAHADAALARNDASEARRHLALVMEGIHTAPLSVYPTHSIALAVIHSKRGELVAMRAPHAAWPPLQRALVDAEQYLNPARAVTAEEAHRG